MNINLQSELSLQLMFSFPIFTDLLPHIDRYSKEEIKRSIDSIKDIKIFKDRILNAAPVYPFTMSDISHSYITTRELDLLKSVGLIVAPFPIYTKLSKSTFDKLIRIHMFKNDSYIYKKTERSDFYYVLIDGITGLITQIEEETNCEYIVAKYVDLDSTISHICDLVISTHIRNNPDTIDHIGVTLIMSEECNQRCVYCYEPKGNRNKEVMSFDIAKKVLSKISPNGKVTFFGGEPMMNIPLMKDICEWGWNNKNFQFEIVTNGQLTDRKFIAQYLSKFIYVQLSVDGPEHVHDVSRGHGSFKRAMEFFNSFYEETGRYPQLHPVLAKANITSLFDTVKWFYEMSKLMYDSNGKYSFRILAGDAVTWEKGDTDLLRIEWDKITEWYLQNRIWESETFDIEAFVQAEEYYSGNKQSCSCDSDSGSKPKDNKFYPKQSNEPFCSAGRKLFAALPNGDMVPCHHENWAISGDIVRYGIDEDLNFVNHMANISCNDITPCNKCEQFGCCICPGSFYTTSGVRTTPEKIWCEVGKIVIMAAKVYIGSKSHYMISRVSQSDIDTMSTAIDYIMTEKAKHEE